MKLETFALQTHKEVEAVNITPIVESFVQRSGTQNGVVHIYNQHTSAGIIVTEGIPCLEEDVATFLRKLVPEEGNYMHRHYLDFDGRVAFNAPMHLRSVLTGYTASFPIVDGRIVKGSRQTIYFMEFDGPLERTVAVQVIGE